MVDGQYVLKVSNPAEDPGAVDLESRGAGPRRPGRPRPAAAPHGPDPVGVVDGDRRRRRRSRVPGPRHHRPARGDGGGPAGHHLARRGDRRRDRADEHRPAGALPPGGGPRARLGRTPRGRGAGRRRPDRARPDRRRARAAPVPVRRRRGRVAGAAQRRQPRGHHADQRAGRRRRGDRPHRPRGHPPHGQRLRPGRHPLLGHPQHGEPSSWPTPGSSPAPSSPATSGTGS